MPFTFRLLRSLLVASVSISVSGVSIAPLLAEETVVRENAPRELRQATRTGKERLAGKASDEQRVNDCKVPENLRGSSQRPANCAAPKAPLRPSE